MLQNAWVAAFTVSELLRENQQGGRGEYVIPSPLPPLSPPPPRLGLKQTSFQTLLIIRACGDVPAHN